MILRFSKFVLGLMFCVSANADSSLNLAQSLNGLDESVLGYSIRETVRGGTVHLERDVQCITGRVERKVVPTASLGIPPQVNEPMVEFLPEVTMVIRIENGNFTSSIQRGTEGSIAMYYQALSERSVILGLIDTQPIDGAPAEKCEFPVTSIALAGRAMIGHVISVHSLPGASLESIAAANGHLNMLGGVEKWLVAPITLSERISKTVIFEERLQKMLSPFTVVGGYPIDNGFPNLRAIRTGDEEPKRFFTTSFQALYSDPDMVKIDGPLEVVAIFQE